MPLIGRKEELTRVLVHLQDPACRQSTLIGPGAAAKPIWRWKPRQQLLNYVRKKRLLLVLDNFEHLPDGVDLVRDLVAGMDCPPRTTGNLDDCQSFAAVELFLQSARRIRPDLELTDDDVADVARICCLVEGLPLGILLAAS